MNALQKKLSVAALIALALCGISYLPFVREKSAPRAFPTALLNPAYADTVSRIVIGQGAYTVTLEKTQTWTATDGQTTVRADSTVVQRFLDAAVSIRNMYIISDRRDQVSPSSVRVLFQDGDTMYTQVDFLGENALTNRIMLAVSSQDAVFETENDLAPFLQPTVRYWAKPELIQTVDAPASFVWQEAGKKPVTVSKASEDFAQVAHDVMALRHGAVVPVQDDGSAQVAELTVSGEGARERIRFVPQGDGSFHCAYTFSGTENRSLSVAFDISGWTFERLRGMFSGR